MEAFNCINSYPKTFKFSEVENGEYPLKELSRIQTQYGFAIIALLEKDGEEIQLFLPKRYEKLREKDIKKINKVNYILEYEGREDCGKMHPFYKISLKKMISDDYN